MANLEINGRTFRDLDSYNAARRDSIIIERMKDRIDMTDINSVMEMRDNIESGKYRFESILGDDFLDELEDIIKQLKEDEQKAVTTKSKSKEKNVRVNKKTNPKKQNAKAFEDYDEDMQQEILRQIKKRETKRRCFVGLMSLVAFGCIGYLAFYGYQYAKNNLRYNELEELIDEDVSSHEYSVNIVNEDKTKPPILKKYEGLYQKNHKIVGWIKIEDTNIDYPVMQTVNNEYYLDHNFNQEYDKNGSIFMDKDCDAAFGNDNIILYGHHMKSGNMFGNLNRYAKESYYKEHPLIQFDTIYEEGTYEVMYVFRSHIYSEEEIVFKYYRFIDATSEDEFYSNLDEMSEMSLYDTGVTATYGDRLLTLSTCDNSENNGRFVVVAKKIK